MLFQKMTIAFFCLICSFYSCVQIDSTYNSQAKFKFLAPDEISFLAKGHTFEAVQKENYNTILETLDNTENSKNYKKFDLHKEKKTGWYYEVRNGVIKKKAQMKDTLFHGFYIVFHDNDNPLQLGQYVNGRKSGHWNEFYPSGNQYGRGLYQNDVKVKDWMYYDENGIPMEEHIYQDETGNYTFIQYDSLGRHRADGAYLSGKEHGEWKVFDESMKLISLYNYVNGNNVGYFEEQLDNGNMAKGYFSRDGKPEGEVKIFNADKELIDVMIFENDSLIQNKNNTKIE